MKNRKIVWFSAFRRVVPADYEAWLEKQAAEGWHVKKIGQWSSILMMLYRGEPKKYRYVYDMQIMPRKDYKSTYMQFGWEFVGRMASVYIWRKPYNTERPEAFTDCDSLSRRGGRVVAAIAICVSLEALAAIALTVPLVFFRHTLSSEDIVQIRWAFVFFAAFTAILGLVAVTIAKNKNR